MAEALKLKKSNCKNCYKCIRHCPVKSIRFSGSQAHIVENECILCGQCFVVCPQNAKEVVDSTEKVKVLLQDGNVYASLAPSFAANYDGIGITPDIEIELPEELQNQNLFLIDRDEDTQLAAALDALKALS